MSTKKKVVRKRVVKRKGPNKADAVREALTANPKQKNSEIVAALAAKDIKVAPSQVSNIRKKMFGGTATRRVSKRTAGAKASGPLTLTSLLEAKAFANKVGGVENARKLVEALAEFRS